MAIHSVGNGKFIIQGTRSAADIVAHTGTGDYHLCRIIGHKYNRACECYDAEYRAIRSFPDFDAALTYVYRPQAISAEDAAWEAEKRAVAQFRGDSY